MFLNISKFNFKSNMKDHPNHTNSGYNHRELDNTVATTKRRWKCPKHSVASHKRRNIKRVSSTVKVQYFQHTKYDYSTIKSLELNETQNIS